MCHASTTTHPHLHTHTPTHTHTDTHTHSNHSHTLIVFKSTNLPSHDDEWRLYVWSIVDVCVYVGVDVCVVLLHIINRTPTTHPHTSIHHPTIIYCCQIVRCMNNEHNHIHIYMLMHPQPSSTIHNSHPQLPHYHFRPFNDPHTYQQHIYYICMYSWKLEEVVESVLSCGRHPQQLWKPS